MKYEVRHKSDRVCAGCWDKNGPMEYAVFGPCLGFVFGEVVGLFLKKEHAYSFAEKMNSLVKNSYRISITFKPETKVLEIVELIKKFKLRETDFSSMIIDGSMLATVEVNDRFLISDYLDLMELENAIALAVTVK